MKRLEEMISADSVMRRDRDADLPLLQFMHRTRLQQAAIDTDMRTGTSNDAAILLGSALQSARLARYPPDKVSGLMSRCMPSASAVRQADQHSA